MHAMCIPFISAAKQDAYWPEEEELQIIFELRRFNKDPNCEFIFHNGAYDCQYFARQWGYCPNIKHDTMIKQHVAFAGLRKSLALCSSLYCNYHRFWKDDGKEWNEGTDERQLWTYNCEDCVRTFEVDQSLEKIIQMLGLEEQYRFQMHELWPEVYKTMLRGVKIDLARRSQFDLRLEQSMLEIEKWFQAVLGHDLNPRSTQQIGRLLYDDLGVPPIKSRKTGSLTTDDEALEKIKAKYPLLRPLLQRIGDYRSLGVYRSTFVQAPLSEDDRMRCSYNLAGTETYRFSSREDAFGTGTNLQNIPAGDE
jgi:DNA polymerase I-like protein with 3'-5' exonuclease and polymerase domains